MIEEEVYLVKHLETIEKSLGAAKAELAYIRWLEVEKLSEIDGLEDDYENLGNMLVDKGLVEKKP